MTKDKKNNIVILGTKHDKKQAKNIAEEPEMKELKRMIRDGELDQDRTINHLQEEDESEE